MRSKLQNKEMTEAKAPIRGEHAKKPRKFSPKLNKQFQLRLKDAFTNHFSFSTRLKFTEINSTIHCLPGYSLAKYLQINNNAIKNEDDHRIRRSTGYRHSRSHRQTHTLPRL